MLFPGYSLMLCLVFDYNVLKVFKRPDIEIMPNGISLKRYLLSIGKSTINKHGAPSL